MTKHLAIAALLVLFACGVASCGAPARFFPAYGSSLAEAVQIANLHATKADTVYLSVNRDKIQRLTYHDYPVEGLKGTLLLTFSWPQTVDTVMWTAFPTDPPDYLRLREPVRKQYPKPDQEMESIQTGEIMLAWHERNFKREFVFKKRLIWFKEMRGLRD